MPLLGFLTTASKQLSLEICPSSSFFLILYQNIFVKISSPMQGKVLCSLSARDLITPLIELPGII